MLNFEDRGLCLSGSLLLSFFRPTRRSSKYLEALQVQTHFLATYLAIHRYDHWLIACYIGWYVVALVDLEPSEYYKKSKKFTKKPSLTHKNMIKLIKVK